MRRLGTISLTGLVAIISSTCVTRRWRIGNFFRCSAVPRFKDCAMVAAAMRLTWRASLDVAVHCPRYQRSDRKEDCNDQYENESIEPIEMLPPSSSQEMKRIVLVGFIQI